MTFEANLITFRRPGPVAFLGFQHKTKKKERKVLTGESKGAQARKRALMISKASINDG